MKPPTDNLLQRLGQRLRAARNERRMSMRDVAEASGVSERFVFQVEKGQANVSVSKLDALARVLNLEVYELLQPADPSPSLRRFNRWAADASGDDVFDACRRAMADDAHRARNIALLGMRGAGKSSVGQRLAALCNLDFVELDARIEARAEMPLADIFSLHGPEYYEELEHDCLEELLDGDGAWVLATGGGVVTHAASFDLLTSCATCVWLKAAPETHWRRVLEQGDRRPMAGNPRAFEQLCTILEQREPLYARAVLTVDTDTHPVNEVAEIIADWIGPAAGGPDRLHSVAGIE